MALTSALAPVAADVIGRGSGLMDLLKPLDYPRQAVANAGQSLLEMLQGQRSIPGGLMGMAPALAGAGVGTLLGNPMLGLALGGGALQGALGSTGMEEFQAPTPQDVAGSVGLGDNFLGTIAANAAIDPLSFLGMPRMPRGARAPAVAPVDEMARAMGAPPLNPLTPDDLQYIDLPASPGLSVADEIPTATVSDELERLAGRTRASAQEAATLGSAEASFGAADRGMTGLARLESPGGEYRFGNILDPNVPPPFNVNHRSELQAMLAQAQDPRMPFVRYRDQATEMLPWLSEPHTTTVRVNPRNAPDVMELLDRTNQSMLPPGPGGELTFAGGMPPGLEQGMALNTRGNVWVGEGGIPFKPPQFELGPLPDDLLVPSPQMSLAQLSGPDAEDILRGLPPVDAPIPENMINWPGLSGLSPDDINIFRNTLAGIGQGEVGAPGFRHVVDLPLDQARAVLAREGQRVRSSLQAHMNRAAALSPQEQAYLRTLGLEPGAAPVQNSRLFMLGDNTQYADF